MNSFDRMGEAMLLVQEGQRQFAHDVARAVKSLFNRRANSGKIN